MIKHNITVHHSGLQETIYYTILIYSPYFYMNIIDYLYLSLLSIIIYQSILLTTIKHLKSIFLFLMT